MHWATVTAGRGGAAPAVGTGVLVSVIVPVRNEAACIGRLLQQLLAQDFDSPAFEVLVIDGRSTDATRQVVAGFAAEDDRVKLLDNPRRWSSAARNVGVRHARGDYVVVIDGHCDLGNPNYLAEIVRLFQETGADCLGRPQPLNGDASGEFQQAVALARASWLGHHPQSYIYANGDGFVPPQSVAIAYRRTVFEEVGFFDERFDACEDVEFNHRIAAAGLRCYFSGRIKVEYHARSSPLRLVRQMIRYGRGRVRFMRKHPAAFSPACFAPPLFFLAVAVAFLGSLLLNRAWWPAALLAGGYLSVVLAQAALVGARTVRPLRSAALVALVYLAVHTGVALGVAAETVAPRGNPYAT